AARGSLYAFAPPPHFTRITRARGRRPVDAYRGRAPLVSGLACGGAIVLHHHRGGGTRGALVVVSRGVGILADLVARRLATALVVLGFDAVIPRARSRNDATDEGDWATSIG